MALKNLDSFALGWLAILNFITVMTFALDKWCASRARRRVPESTLVLLGALGGWPGGLLGMKYFRHKTAKWTFQFKYALALLPFIAELWAWQHWR